MLVVGLLTALFSAGGNVEPKVQRLDQIHLRDPFILPVQAKGRYYLFGTGWPSPPAKGFLVYTSTDLVQWTGPLIAFEPHAGFVSENFWAPEVHFYRGKYYMFCTFKPAGRTRGTYILESEKPGGPCVMRQEKAITPADWYCLDGTLYVDDAGVPWMVFCHEWVEVGDGEICAIRLARDLSRAEGEPKLLFKASEAPWGHVTGINPSGRVTDGPFLHRTGGGALLMLWSSFGEGGYKLAVARSESGKLEGPWKQESQPIYGNDGGHGMLFRTFDGKLMAVFHQPNRSPMERPRLFRVLEKADTIQLGDEVTGTTK